MRSRNEAIIVILLVCSLIAFGLGTGIGITTGMNGHSQAVQDQNQQLSVNGSNVTSVSNTNSSDEVNTQDVQSNLLLTIK